MKTDNVFEYKGYLGSAEVSFEDGCLYGVVLSVNDVIAYSGDTVAELEQNFRDAVDGYLDVCRESSLAPSRPRRRLSPRTEGVRRMDLART